MNCVFGLYPSSGVSRTNKINFNSFNTNTPSSESYKNDWMCLLTHYVIIKSFWKETRIIKLILIP